MTSESRKTVGLVGLFDDPDSLMKAAEAVRDAGFKKWDCHTPYPVHGLDRAMGMGPSPVPYVTITAGFVGIGVALLMQGWMDVIDYPIRIGGKPLWSWPAFVPICFELFVLFAALSTLGSVLVMCRLGRWHSPLHDTGVMAEITSSRFAVVLDAQDSRFSPQASEELLRKAGCRDVRPLVEDSGEGEAH